MKKSRQKKKVMKTVRVTGYKCDGCARFVEGDKPPVDFREVAAAITGPDDEVLVPEGTYCLPCLIKKLGHVEPVCLKPHRDDRSPFDVSRVVFGQPRIEVDPDTPGGAPFIGDPPNVRPIGTIKPIGGLKLIPTSARIDPKKLGTTRSASRFSTPDEAFAYRTSYNTN